MAAIHTMSEEDLAFIRKAMEKRWLFWVFFWRWPRLLSGLYIDCLNARAERDKAVGISSVLQNIEAERNTILKQQKSLLKWVHTTHRLSNIPQESIKALFAAGRRLKLGVLFLGLAISVQAQVPPLLRNHWTTNAAPRAITTLLTNGVRVATNIWELDLTNSPTVTITAISNASGAVISFTSTNSGSSGSSSITNALLYAGPTNGSVSPLILTAGDGITLTTSGTNRIIAVSNTVAEISDLVWTNDAGIIYPLQTNGPVVWGDIDAFSTWWGWPYSGFLGGVGVDSAAGHQSLELEYAAFDSTNNDFADLNIFLRTTANPKAHLELEARKIGGTPRAYFVIDATTAEADGKGDVLSKYESGSSLTKVNIGNFHSLTESGFFAAMDVQSVGTNVYPISVRWSSPDGLQTTLWRLGTNSTMVCEGKIFASAPVLDAWQVWTNASVVFDGFKLNFTNQASAAGSKYFRIQNSGSDVFAIFPNGISYFANTITNNTGTTNAFIVKDTSGGYTRLYTDVGVLYSSASPPFRTVEANLWASLTNIAITGALTNLTQSPLAAGQLAITNGNTTPSRGFKSLQASTMISLTDQGTNILIVGTGQTGSAALTNVAAGANVTNLSHSPLAAGQLAITNGSAGLDRGLKSLQAGTMIALTDQNTNIIVTGTGQTGSANLTNLSATAAITNITVTVITNTGVSLYTVPSGVKYIMVECLGGGGGGGGVDGVNAQSAAGGGGGSGAYCSTNITTPAASYIVTVGTNGLGGAGAGGNAGTIGGTTSFTNILTALGGSGGAGKAAAAAVSITLGGVGALETATGKYYTGGNPGENGICVSAALAISGSGAGSIYGGGGAGQTAAAGGVATGKGAGGGGAASISVTDRDGGRGSPGVIIVREFYQ
jgi:hypothetical protein